ncbi:hypothetical protein GCM10010221_23170 [Streptomyces parvus]|nr:hypothetical protein GCM10010221_23170 [Streptomyces parvus]
MTGTAIHFTHQGIPANISRTAIASTSSLWILALDAKGEKGSGGHAQPLKTPDRAPRDPREETTAPGRYGQAPQPSGGEKTTITLRSSVMWWNLWATPAGT